MTELSQEPPGDWPKTVSRMRVEGRRRRQLQFADSTEVSPFGNGPFWESFDLTADTARVGGELVVVLRLKMEPSFPSDLYGILRLAIRRGVAVPVTSWCLIDESWSSGSGFADAVGFDSGYFGFLVPMRPRFDRAEGGFEPVVEREPTAPELAIVLPDRFRLEEAQPRGDRAWDTHSRHTIRLYGEPSGDSVDSVLVTPESTISFGRAWARVVDGCYCCLGVESPPEPELRRLEVTVDGRHGFVEQGDFDALGLFWVN